MRTREIEELELFLSAQAQKYGRIFSSLETELFAQYFTLALKWNPLLHLTTITSPQEFAERHILESAFAVQYLAPTVKMLWDIGSGMGVPGIPLAILRPDLAITLVESSQKKCIFLNEVKDALKLHNLDVLNTRFEKIKCLGADSCLVSRAIDQMRRFLPNLLDLGKSSTQILLFGNQSLLKIVGMYALSDRELVSHCIPNTKSRLLISLTRST